MTITGRSTPGAYASANPDGTANASAEPAWAGEIRLVVEERASFAPDALTGMEANFRCAGPETSETKIFGRLSAWQNWVFQRPSAAGPQGALSRYGTGQRADYDFRRV
jgi:benzoyl-CoA-dihydrodiol lyase